MKLTGIAVLFLAASMTGIATAADTDAPPAVKKIKESCQTELETYCKKVSPGEGRVFACLYAYEDKLSSRCEYTLYEVAKQLDEAVTKLNTVATECAGDLTRYCSEVKKGEGRIANCLKKNQDKVVPACRQAMTAAAQ